MKTVAENFDGIDPIVADMGDPAASVGFTFMASGAGIAATVADEDFEDDAVQDSGGAPMSIDGITYASDNGGVAIIDSGQDFPVGSGHNLMFNARGDGAVATTFSFGSADPVNDFRLVSFDMDVFGNEYTYPFASTYTIYGYSGGANGTLVAYDTVDFTVSDAQGSITYSKISYAGGTLTFSADWDNIDTVVFVRDGGVTAHAIIDNIDFEAASPPPSVVSVTVPPNGTYKAGSVLEFTVTFDEDVTVVGTPQLALVIGNQTVYADYSSGSGPTLTFRYTVLAGQVDADGISIPTGALTLSGGTIRDAAGNDASLVLGTLPSTTGVTVEATLPEVSSIVRNGPETRGDDKLTFTVTFSENVSGVTADDFFLSTVGTAYGSIYSVTGSGNTYVVTVDNLVGDGIIGLNLKSSGTNITDAYGNPVKGGYSAGETYTLDNTGPGRPSVPDLRANSDMGWDDTDNITADNTVTLTGTAEAGATVALYDGNGDVIGVGTADGGTWTITTSVLPDGMHDISAMAFDEVGNSSLLSNPLTVTVDTTHPTVVITSDVDSLKAGDSATITFIFSEDPGATFTLGDVQVVGGTLSGLSGSGAVRTATFTPTPGMNGGTASITVGAGSYTDRAGNSGGAGATPSLTFDTLAPDAPSTPDLVDASDTGSSSSDNITADTTPTFSGTAEVGATVRLYDGATEIGSVVATDGTWSITTFTLAAGSHSIVAVAVDPAGNVGHASQPLVIHVVTDPPSTQVTGMAFSQDNGTSVTDLVTNTASQTIAGTLDAPLALGEHVEVSFDGGQSWITASIDMPTLWSLSTTLAEGTHTISVRVVNAVGYGGPVLTQSYTLDTIAPTIDTAASTPADNGSGIHPDADIVLRFDGAVFPGTGGSIVLYNVTDGSVIETIPYGSPLITGWGTDTITIDPAGPLPQGKHVSVRWDSTVFRDLAGNHVAGNASDTLLNFTVADLPEPPTATNLTQTKSVAEDSSPVALDDIVVTDPDIGDTITVTLTLSDPAAGSLATGTYGAATSTFDHRTGVWTVIGAVADVNAALAGVSFNPALNWNGTVTITTRVRDEAGTGPADGAVTVSVTPVNDGPVATIPPIISVTEDTLNALTGISFSDLDAGAGHVTATFSIATGTLLADSAAGVTVGGSASALTLTGTIADINAFIAASGVIYVPAQDDTGTRVLIVTIDDHGNSGAGGARTDTKVINLYIAGVNDSAIIAGDVAGSVTEDVAFVTSGILTVADVDAGEDGFQPMTDVTGTYGTFSFNHLTGRWSYALDNGSAAVQALHQGEVRHDTFTVKALDGTQKTVTISVNGTKDAEVIDGVDVDRTETVNQDGFVSQVVTIPVVTAGRTETDGDVRYADIPLVTVGGRSVLSVQVGAGIGLTASGFAAPKAVGSSLADLIREIKAHVPAGSSDQPFLTGGGSGFLSGLPATRPLLVQSIVATQSSAIAGVPLVISGSSRAGDPATALVIDARGLAAGTVIELQNVTFAAIIGSVRLTGGAGSQVVFGDGASQHMVLGAADDTIHGGGGHDYVGSHGGNDRLYGDAGNDTVSGGTGHDSLWGGTGNDRLLGGSGNDRLDGGTGHDKLYGDSGNDTLIGGTGNDTLDGGTGADRLIGGAGNNRLLGGSGNDRLIGDAGHDSLKGDAGNDTLTGGSGNDALWGGTGADRLDGGSGNDTLKGNSGNDWIVGGLGRDKLWGGAGADIFDFNAVQESRPGSQRDIIYDFQSGRDRIDLRGIDANEARKGNQAFSWIGTKGPFLHPDEAASVFMKVGFTGRAGELRYDRGILMGDTDGDGRADFEIRIIGRFSVGDVIL